MHEEKISLVREQVGVFQKTLTARRVESVYFVACGGSLATLYPGKYIVERETDRVGANLYNAAEFVCDPPARLNETSLVFFNSQSGSTPETVAAVQLAARRGALTVVFTAEPGSAAERAADCAIFYYDDPAHPYPARLTIFPEVYEAVFAALDVWNGTERRPQVEDAMDRLQHTLDGACAQYRQAAREFARAYCREPLIYTVAAGLDACVGYILTNCLFMESLWIHSSPLHAGEFFHGALEAVDERTALLAFLGLGKTRPVEERCVRFLQRKTQKLTVLDAKALDFSEYPDWMRDYVAPLVLNRLAALYCEETAALRGHPLSSRRYMGVEKY